MSYHHFIRILLNLEDKNIAFEKEFCQKVEIKGLVSLLYFAILSYKPTHCPNCGIVNKNFSIVKNGFYPLG